MKNIKNNKVGNEINYFQKKQREEETQDKILSIALLLVAVVATILFIDLMGYMAWVISGQTPSDGGFIGSITNLIFKTF